MTLVSRAAFVFENAASDATITASSSLPKTPPSRLLTQHVGQAWCAETDTAYLTIALASAAAIDSIGLFGVNGTAAMVSRVRVSLTDASAQDGALYDSGSAIGRISDYYRNLVALMDSAEAARYIRIDLSEAGIARIMAGFLVIGLRNEVTFNFSAGATDTLVDPSVVTPARSGAEWIDQRRTSRDWGFNFESLTEAERFGWIEDMERLVGLHQNVMVIRKCDSADLGRDTLCGRITTADPVISRQGVFAGGGVYSKAFKVRERL